MLLAVAVLGAGCGGRAAQERVVSNSVGAGDRAVLRGAGSTFAAPMVAEWARLYRAGAPGVDVRYEASGSGAGLRRLPARTAEFALSELPVPEEEQRQGAVQIPVLAGAVAVAYNLAGVTGLRLSEETLARIYSGEIRRWDAAAIKRDNPGRQLPPTALTALHRSDASGSTLAFTRYLASAGDIWRPGPRESLESPAGAGAVGSAGMLTALAETAGAIGYVSAGAALNARLAVASLRNGAGQFVAPTPVAVDAALNGATGNAENLTLSVPVTQDSPTAYPIVVISHLVFLTGLAQPVDVALRRFAGWILADGQRAATRLGFSPLPLPLAVRTLEGLQAGGMQPRR